MGIVKTFHRQESRSEYKSDQYESHHKAFKLFPIRSLRGENSGHNIYSLWKATTKRIEMMAAESGK